MLKVGWMDGWDPLLVYGTTQRSPKKKKKDSNEKYEVWTTYRTRYEILPIKHLKARPFYRKTNNFKDHLSRHLNQLELN